jgi:hypothetical protein
VKFGFAVLKKSSLARNLNDHPGKGLDAAQVPRSTRSSIFGEAVEEDSSRPYQARVAIQKLL